MVQLKSIGQNINHKPTESINHGVQGKELKANIVKRHNERDAG